MGLRDEGWWKGKAGVVVFFFFLALGGWDGLGMRWIVHTLLLFPD